MKPKTVKPKTVKPIGPLAIALRHSSSGRIGLVAAVLAGLLVAGVALLLS